MKKVLVLSFATLFVACAGSSARPGGGDETTPPWVAQGTGAVRIESGKKLQGVAVARNPDPKLRRQAADDAASRQLQREIDALAAQVVKTGENTGVHAGEAIAALARKAAERAAHVRDHWVTPDGAENALDRIELGALRQAVQATEGDEAARRELAAGLDRAFDQLSRM